MRCEGPAGLVGVYGDVTVHDLSTTSDAERAQEQTVIERFGKGDDERRRVRRL